MKKIWIDLDNSPHVPFFDPIIKELRKNKFEVLITARDCFQVCGLADLKNLEYTKAGRHYGKNKILKIMGTFIRAAQLIPIIIHNKPSIAISHGSRSQQLSASFLCIPTILIFDYEHAQFLPFARPTFEIAPEVILESKPSYRSKNNIFTYPGLKEDVYIPFLRPDHHMLEEMQIDKQKILVTIRPPATEAHYHNPESDILFEEVLNYLGHHENVQMVILPRNEIKQTAFIKNNWPEWCSSRKIIIPEHVVNGINLIWFSDFVISGGGTMNREAAALGVPVYSIFKGKIGAIDQYLSNTGRLILLESINDVKTKIKVISRDKPTEIPVHSKNTLNAIISNIIKAYDGLHL